MLEAEYSCSECGAQWSHRGHLHEPHYLSCDVLTRPKHWGVKLSSYGYHGSMVTPRQQENVLKLVPLTPKALRMLRRRESLREVEKDPVLGPAVRRELKRVNLWLDLSGYDGPAVHAAHAAAWKARRAADFVKFNVRDGVRSILRTHRFEVDSVRVIPVTGGQQGSPLRSKGLWYAEGGDTWVQFDYDLNVSAWQNGVDHRVYVYADPEEIDVVMPWAVDLVAR
jgi:hypothetical protein